MVVRQPLTLNTILFQLRAPNSTLGGRPGLNRMGLPSRGQGEHKALVK